MRKVKVALLSVAVLALGTAAQAAVSLQFSAAQVTVDKLANPNFDVTVNVVGNSDQVLGLGYYLDALGLASGHFQILDRRIGTSLFNDPTYDDPTVENPSDAVLAPENNFDLGASTATPVTVSTARLVASYTLKVINTPSNPTPNDTYVIETRGPSPTSGWYGPDFQDQPFVSNASIQVNVVPEPVGLGLAGLMGLGIMTRRRK